MSEGSEVRVVGRGVPVFNGKLRSGVGKAKLVRVRRRAGVGKLRSTKAATQRSDVHGANRCSAGVHFQRAIVEARISPTSM